jgi:hypothetical protein
MNRLPDGDTGGGRMNNLGRKFWVIVLIYALCLGVSLAVFWKNPNPHPGRGPDGNALFRLLGPTLGSLILVIIMLVKMARGRISLVAGAGAILVLAVVSILCLARSMPIMMGI